MAKHPRDDCKHPQYADFHCAEMICPNYTSRCPMHAPSGSPINRCNNDDERDGIDEAGGYHEYMERYAEGE